MLPSGGSAGGGGRLYGAPDDDRDGSEVVNASGTRLPPVATGPGDLGGPIRWGRGSIPGGLRGPGVPVGDKLTGMPRSGLDGDVFL